MAFSNIKDLGPDLPSIGSSSYGSNTSVFDLSRTCAPMYQQVPVEEIVRLANANLIAKNEREKTMRRLVKVVIIDTNENVPLEDCVLYNGSEKLTDATDQELYFEIDVKGILDQHNAKRVKLIDRKVKERTEHLEPAKIRDLKMVVVNVATF